MISENDYSKLDNILQIVHKVKIKLDDDDKKQAFQICNKVERVVKDRLAQSNSLLKAFTNGTTYRGSFFGGVKIKKPDEFDIDIQLKLPLKYNQIRLEIPEPGFVAINIKKAYEQAMKIPTWAEKYSGLKNFMDDKGYLIESQVKKEMESVLVKSFSPNTFTLDLGNNLLAEGQIVKSGPAFTFNINCDNIQVDIDFVFGIYFEDIWPPKPTRRVQPPMPKNFWFAVPKEGTGKRSWRISFPAQEKYLLDGNNNLKFIYRLLKSLRDEEKWNLASYQICTLFLWQSNLAIVDGNKKFWQRSLGTLFMHMLTLLKEALDAKQIKFFWDERNNMIQKKHESNILNMSGRVNTHLRQINLKYQNDQLLLEYVLRNMFRIDVSALPNLLSPNTLCNL